ncbi:MAG: AraC family transcriptional regulator [Oscillospiraceae bacterium]|jgi:AraC-like DNA-binding protein|nr:AraC family transcriptional regulator [Oscillospiraceae bacterium]
MECIYPDVSFVIDRQTYKGWKVGTRALKDHELVLITAGKGSVTVGNRNYPLKENDILYFPPGLIHALNTDETNFMIFYAAHFDLAGKGGRLPLPVRSHVDVSIQIRRLWREMHEVYIKKPYMRQWKQNIIFQNILYEIFAVSRDNILPKNLQRVNKVIAYIHANPYKKFSVADLTQIAGIKKAYFMHIFKAITKQTPLKYTLNLKLEHSKNMLANTSLPIKEIAEICGFNDGLYYSRMFRSAFGISPSAFRAEMK